MRTLLIVAAILALGVAAWFVYDRTRDAGLQPQPAPAEPDVPVVVDRMYPVVQVVRDFADGDVEIVWQIEANWMEDVVTVEAELISTRREHVVSSGVLDAGARVHRFSAPMQAGESYDVYAIAVDQNNYYHYSRPQRRTYPTPAAVPLPTVENLIVQWRPVDGVPAASVSWSAPAGDAIIGFVVMADDEVPGLLLEKHAPDNPVPDTSVMIELQNSEARELTVAVAAVNRSLQRGESTLMTMRAPVSVMPVPANVAVTRDEAPGAPLALAWEYPEAADLVGFRVHGHGLLLADETRLTADARGWFDAVLPDDFVYQYNVQAVFDGSLLSPKSETVEYEVILTAADRAPPQPTGLVAAWVNDGAGPTVSLKWDQPAAMLGVTGHRLRWGPVGSEPVTQSQVIQIGETRFATGPMQDPQALEFQLVALSDEGAESVHARARVLSPAELIPPARLLDYRVNRQTDGVSVEWIWRYPDSPLLTGFRLYQDRELVADESALGRDARSWTSGLIADGGRYAFEIEAIFVGETVAVRSPPQYFDYTP